LLGRRIGARGRLFQGARPALAGDDAALGIEIEKDVVLAASSTRYAESEMPIRRKASRSLGRSHAPDNGLAGNTSIRHQSSEEFLN